MEDFKENLAIIAVIIISVSAVVYSSYKTAVREHDQIAEISENRSDLEKTNSKLKEDLKSIHASLDQIEANLDLIKKEIEKREKQKE
jgi:septal ring factor EnvC (AmiA/AmiB activator)